MFLQDKNRAAFEMDAAAKYDFAGNRASLSFNANNIFNGRKQKESKQKRIKDAS